MGDSTPSRLDMTAWGGTGTTGLNGATHDLFTVETGTVVVVDSVDALFDGTGGGGSLFLEIFTGSSTIAIWGAFPSGGTAEILDPPQVPFVVPQGYTLRAVAVGGSFDFWVSFRKLPQFYTA